MGHHASPGEKANECRRPSAVAGAGGGRLEPSVPGPGS